MMWAKQKGNKDMIDLLESLVKNLHEYTEIEQLQMDHGFERMFFAYLCESTSK